MPIFYIKYKMPIDETEKRCYNIEKLSLEKRGTSTMKKNFLIFLLTILTMLACAVGFSACGEQSNSLTFKTFTVEGTKVNGVVSNATTEFSFKDEVEVNGKVKYVVSLDKNGMQMVFTKIVSLAEGDNQIYLFEMIDDEIVNTYEVTIRRRPMYTVTFDAYGLANVEDQIVEEGSYAVEPNITFTTIIGYTFGWLYDFTQPITQDTLIKGREIKEEFSIFYFTSTEDTCVITGVKDKTVTEIVIPDGATIIGESAFAYCSSLTSVVIPDSVTSIDEWAFTYCSSLTSVVIGNGVTSIGYGAFNGCSSLTSVVIGNGVTSIDHAAFNGCSSLTSVVIPDSVTSIGNSVFEGCESLQYTIKAGLKYLGNPNNAYVYLADTETTNITTAVIENGCKVIGYDAFYYCSSLTSIKIPDSVTSIGDYAFEKCSSLTSVIIPDSVTTIGSCAFASCSSLTSVIIPDSVTTIGSCAFSGCSSLTSITFKDTSTWYYTTDYLAWTNKMGGTKMNVNDPSNNATYFTSIYDDYYWYKL